MVCASAYSAKLITSVSLRFVAQAWCPLLTALDMSSTTSYDPSEIVRKRSVLSCARLLLKRCFGCSLQSSSPLWKSSNLSSLAHLSTKMLPYLIDCCVHLYEAPWNAVW